MGARLNRLTHSFAVAFVIAVGVASAGFLVSFVISNIAMFWVVKRYPQHNSMAGFVAFVYSYRVSAVCGVIAFFVALFLVFRKTKPRGLTRT
jgi:hypothetical protein